MSLCAALQASTTQISLASRVGASMDPKCTYFAPSCKFVRMGRSLIKSMRVLVLDAHTHKTISGMPVDPSLGNPVLIQKDWIVTATDFPRGSKHFISMMNIGPDSSFHDVNNSDEDRPDWTYLKLDTVS